MSGIHRDNLDNIFAQNLINTHVLNFHRQLMRLIKDQANVCIVLNDILENILIR